MQFRLGADKYDWDQNKNGNYVLLDDGSSVVATVFQNNYEAWQIIINTEDRGRLVADEYFMNPEAAIERANEILAGADCVFKLLRNRYWEPEEP